MIDSNEAPPETAVAAQEAQAQAHAAATSDGVEQTTSGPSSGTTLPSIDDEDEILMFD